MAQWVFQGDLWLMQTNAGDDPIQMRLIPQSSYLRARWKNGLGHTDQIAIFPENADLRRGDFLFRLSTARIEQSSPFSEFPNHDRTLTILNGEGIRMIHSVDSPDDQVEEIPRMNPYEFPGDIPSRCELLGKSVQDLSLFIRKGECEASTEVFVLEPNQEMEVSCPILPGTQFWGYVIPVARGSDASPLVCQRGDQQLQVGSGDSVEVRDSGEPPESFESDPPTLKVCNSSDQTIEWIWVTVQAVR
jgi:environmental stress-induced protein Ves